MSELFDMVPSEYRESQRLKGRLKVFIGLYLFLVVAIVAGKLLLEQKLTRINSEVQSRQVDKQFALQEQQHHDALRGQITTLEERLKILSGLRGGPSSEQLFDMLNRALEKNVWFDRWSFMRADEWKEPVPESVHMGYLIVVPKGDGQQRQQAWRMSTHMEIKGQALDHSALAAFVQKLLQQPEIEDVKVLKTALREYTAVSVVDYSLAVIVNGNLQVKK